MCIRDRIDAIVALWLSQPEWLRTTLISVGQILAVTITVILCVAYTTLAERKVIGYMQMRIGPNRVGPFGLLQPLADGVKFFTKEDFMPNAAERWLYILAPGAFMFVACMTSAVIQALTPKTIWAAPAATPTTRIALKE